MSYTPSVHRRLSGRLATIASHGQRTEGEPIPHDIADGLSLAPMRGLRPSVGPDRLGRLLCPPYDVISETDRAALLAADPDNAVSVILPRAAEPSPASVSASDDPYTQAAARLDRWVSTGLYRVDPVPTLYVYEMRTAERRDDSRAARSTGVARSRGRRRPPA